MSTRRVLLLTYYWPPAGGPGVQRFLKFARYLREYGWEPIIITPADGAYPYRDESLLGDIPEGLHVIRTGTREPFALYNRLTGKKGKEVPVAMVGFKDSRSPVQRLAKWVRANFFIPDARVGWKPFAVKAALTEIAAGRRAGAEPGEKICGFITTGPPHSTHLAGLELKRKTGLPWIADFRDPWTTVYYNAFFPRSARTKRVDQRMEDQVLAAADHIAVVSEGMAEEFRGRSRALSVLYNGFDEQDMYTGPLEPSEFFQLVHVGNMKPNQQVPALWQALAECVRSDPGFARHFRLHFTGSLDPGVAQAVRDAGLEHYLEHEPFVAHQEATRRMALAGMLLFVIPDATNNRRIITGKIFEYLACNTRMLAIGPQDGDAAGIMRQAGRGPMLGYTDKDGMVLQLRRAYVEWLSGGQLPLREPGGDYLRFSRRSLTGNLAAILDGLNSRA
ncbi:MAG: glycosyl transferase family 1 [Bacteroidetes bacterium]|nr:glycosyl transferase family 1 [Bacteroidota bacterium]